MIKFFDYSDIYLKNRKKFLKIFDTIASKGSFILGKELEQFEKNIAKFANVKYAVGIIALVFELISLFTDLGHIEKSSWISAMTGFAPNKLIADAVAIIV